MRSQDVGNAPLLLLITSAIAACGGSLAVPDDAGEDAPAARDATVASGTDGALDSDGSHPLLGDTGADAIADDTGADAIADAIGSGEDAVTDAGVDASEPLDCGVSCPMPECQCVGTPDGAASCYCSIRRPFLVGASMRSAKAHARRDWIRDARRIPPLDSRTTARLAEAWLRDALEEHASIAAFARFTLHLMALGAPPDLVVDSQRAALDEVRHARLCFGFAERYGGVALGPAALRVGDALADTSLESIVGLAVEEGCVGETLGASLAAAQLGVSRDPEVTTALRAIARDEARHAALAWRFVAWATTNGGRRMERLVAERLESAVAASLAMKLVDYEGIDLGAWHAHGRVTCHEARAIVERAVRDVVRPCFDALVARSRREHVDSRDSRVPTLLGALPLEHAKRESSES